jgi:Spy/CpxP family protein refolding chaperone
LAPDGGDPPAPPPAAPLADPPAAPAGDPHAAGILRELTETRAELKRMREAAAAREAAEREAAEAEARKRGEHERLLAERDAELAKVRERVSSYEARETAEREAADAELLAAVRARTDADSVLAECKRWGGDDPRRQLAFYRERVEAAAVSRPGAPAPAGAGAPDAALTDAEKAEAKRWGVTEAAYLAGKKRSMANLEGKV